MGFCAWVEILDKEVGKFPFLLQGIQQQIFLKIINVHDMKYNNNYKLNYCNFDSDKRVN